ELRRIEKDFLTFRTVYWFSEVSNQIQGRELFDLFARHLATRDLFAQVADEAREAAQIVAGWNQDRQRRVGELLSLIGVGFLLFAPLASGMAFSTDYFEWPWYTAGSLGLAICGLLLLL